MQPAGASPAAPPAPGPDAGTTPSWDGDLRFPAQPDPTVAPPGDVIGPLAQQIITAQNDAERLGELLKSVTDEQTAAEAVTAPLRAANDQAQAKVKDLQARAAEVTSQAYQNAVALGPFAGYANDLQDLGLLAPGLPVQVPEAARPSERDSIAMDLTKAEQQAAQAQAALDAAVAAESEINGRHTVINEQFQRAQAALSVLKTRNASLLGTLDTLRDTYESTLTASRGLATSINGWQAAPAALAAVNFALRQQGKPYEWAAEGPNSYDCSGLALASYLSVGIALPRVSRDQYRYRGGSPVLVSQLLPGDLLFFSTDRSDSSKIHHVAIYIGNGKMVHAPTFGETVKVSPVWWSEYFGAIRIVPAIAAPGAATTPPAPTPTAPPSPTPTPSPSASPSPSPSPSPSASPSATPTPTPAATPTPTPTPTPTSAATPTPTPTPSAKVTTTTPPPATSTTAPPASTTTPAGSNPALPLAVVGTGAAAARSRRRWPRWGRSGPRR